MARVYPTSLLVKLLDDDITAGVKADCGACPIARSLRRDYPELLASDNDPGFEILDVYGTEFQLGDVCYKMPLFAIYFIGAFDSGRRVEPFTFHAFRLQRFRASKERRKIA